MSTDLGTAPGTGPDEAPEPAPEPAAGRDPRAARVRRVWRVGTPLMAVLSGALFVVSAQSSEGTDLRPGRYTDLASIVSGRSEEVATLRDRANRLDAEVRDLAAQVDDREVAKINADVERLKDPAGRVPVTGEGVTVVLSDAPEAVQDAADIDVNLLVVHQQDIQAVVNAMWLGGAEAVTIQGQRVISTTGIKCSGNAVRLHGIPYAQPYRISAVGDQNRLLRAIDESHDLQIYRAQAANPRIAVGWELQPEDRITAPAYDGSTALSYAEPVDNG